MEFEINAIEYRDFGLTLHDLARIGNNHDGWSISVTSAIERIERERQVFYIYDHLQDKRHYLHVVREKNRPPYLRTTEGGRWTDALLGCRSLLATQLID